MQVIKRDGKIAEFKIDRIVNAVTLAMAQTPKGIDSKLATEIANNVRNNLMDKNQTTIYEIQDLVEKELMGSSRKEVAQEYIIYRYNRDIARKAKVKNAFLDILKSKSKDVNYVQVMENSEDLEEVLTPKEIRNEIAKETSRPFVDDFLLSKDTRDAQINNYIYINKREEYATKSIKDIQIHINKVLESYDVYTIDQALSYLYIYLEGLQSEIHGNIEIVNFDENLSIYFRNNFKEEIQKICGFEGIKSNIIEELVKSNIDEENKFIEFALKNTREKVDSELRDFFSKTDIKEFEGLKINYGLAISKEGRAIKEIIDEIMKDKNENIEKIKVKEKEKERERDKDKDNKNNNRELSKRIGFIEINKIKREEEEYSVENENKPKDIELRNIDNIKRVVLSSTSINLPKIAIESSKRVQEELNIHFEIGKDAEKRISKQYLDRVKEIFLEEIEKYCNLIARQLFDRSNFQAIANPNQYPHLMKELWIKDVEIQENEQLKNIYRNKILEIEYVGIDVALIALMGKKQEDEKEKEKWIKLILKVMNGLCEEYNKRYEMSYELKESNNRQIEKELIEKDRMQYGTLRGITDREKY